MIACFSCTSANCTYYLECTHVNPKIIHMQHLQSEKPKLSFAEWLEELAKVTAEQTGMSIERARKIIRRGDAKTWWEDGFTPFAAFRETYSHEND